MSDQQREPPLTFDEAAGMYTLAGRALLRMIDAGVDDCPLSAPLPRGVVTCGEAVHIARLLLVLLAEMHPQLVDDEILESALLTAVPPSSRVQ